MAIKHVKDYFQKQEEQYLEMKEDLAQLEEAMLSRAIDPDVVENYKKTLKPISDTYNMLSYFMYLLYLPQRNEKSKKRRNAKQEEIGRQRLESLMGVNTQLKEIRKNA